MDKENVRIVICGTGNIKYGDDGAGSELARRLQSEISGKNILILDCGPAPQNYTNKVLGFKPDKVIVVSALDFGESPGTVELIDNKGVRRLLLSTHKVNLELFIGYLRSALEAEIMFIGIQPKTTELGSGMSPECKNAINKAREIVLDIIRH